MALVGSAFVAIWNDVKPEGRENFFEWHSREHMAERIAIDGFIRGRRYMALPGPLVGSPEYFTLYEVRDTEVLAGSAYRARLNAPTPWTLRSMAEFRNVARSLCRTDVSLGTASGGILGTLCFDCAVGLDVALMKTLRAALAELSAATGIVALHVGRADVLASKARSAEQGGRADNAVPRWVVLIEASTAEAVQIALTGHLDTKTLADFGLTDVVRGVYALQFDLLK